MKMLALYKNVGALQKCWRIITVIAKKLRSHSPFKDSLTESARCLCANNSVERSKIYCCHEGLCSMTTVRVCL